MKKPFHGSVELSELKALKIKLKCFLEINYSISCDIQTVWRECLIFFLKSKNLKIFQVTSCFTIIKGSVNKLV